MKTKVSITHALLVIICSCWIIPLIPARAVADVKKKVQVSIGKPSIWSLGQAHYLLSRMHRKNRDIGLNPLDPKDLDPNRANATRLEILRSVLDVEAQFSQKIGVDNRNAMREYDQALKRRANAQTELPLKEEELREETRDLNALKKRLAELQEVDRQSDEVREARAIAESQEKDSDGNKVPIFIPLSEAEQQRKKDIERLEIRIAAQQAKVDGMKEEVGEMKKQATGAVAAPALTEPTLSNNAVSLPGLTNIQALINKALETSGKPSLAASIALDNHIGMQYEIIAKQLTLLRDEAGPDERIIFLELPSSIYTVPCEADDYLVQVQWEVLNVYVRRQDDNEVDVSGEGVRQLIYNPFREARSVTGSPNTVRALDIIPRQSALNINDYHATSSQKNFMGVMKLLLGLGIRVSYQRQRELYEEFLQQEVFASGFGKGNNIFGWTFGPMPGTKRVSPGQRTTYAVLAVPENAFRLVLKANAIAYKRKQAPAKASGNSSDAELARQLIDTNDFTIDIPGDERSTPRVNSIAYSPVAMGSPVSVTIKGDNFTPQMGIIVNGVPLNRALNLSNNEILDVVEPPNTNHAVQGSYELVNSRELAMTFSIKGFVGTPDILLLSPDRATSINFFSMRINYRPALTSLRNQSLKEPMFLEPFTLNKKLQVLPITPPSPDFLRVRLSGTGLRPGAEISVNERIIPDTPNLNPQALPANVEFSYQESTKSYLIQFRNVGGPKWKINFKQKTNRWFDQEGFTEEYPASQPSFEIRHYIARGPNNDAEADLRFFTKVDEPICSVQINQNEGEPLRDRNQARPGSAQGCPQNVPMNVGQTVEKPGQYRARFRVFSSQLGSHKIDRDVVTVTIRKMKRLLLWSVLDQEVKDIALPVRPHVAKILNPRTDKPAGFADEDVTATIAGYNLRGVKKVFFGETEAQIIGSPDHELVVVKVPKVAGLAKGQAVTVPVTVESRSSAEVGGSFAVGTYTYLGEPVPIKVGEPVPVIVDPPVSRPRRRNGTGQR
jgi:hypothetical protein